MPMMYLMLDIPLRAAVVAAFPSQGFALVPLAKLLERMDVLERERVASLLIPATGGNVRTVCYPDVLLGSPVSVDVDDIYALPSRREGFLRATRPFAWRRS